MYRAEWECAISGLPPGLAQLLRGLPETTAGRVQEIRLRADAPVTLSTPGGELMLTRNGAPVTDGGRNAYIITPSELEDCFFRLCEYSVHAHQHELRQGFITAKGGCRVGVAGTAVMDGETVSSIRGITSLCIRVARGHEGAASQLARYVAAGGGLRGILICGEPSSGKTSILRDLAQGLSGGRYGGKYRTSVIDERGELSGGRGLTGGHGLTGCDVLRGFPKAAGIQQAVRCLAPDIILFDELGTTGEVRAVLDSLNAGVAVVATAHGRSAGELLRRPPVREALASGAFEQVAILEGRGRPGQLKSVIRAGDVFDQGSGAGADCAGGRGTGMVRVGGARPAGA